MSNPTKGFEANLEKLRAKATGLEIVTEGEALTDKSHDTWVRSLMERRRDGGGPVASALVRPSNAEEVAAVLAWADETATPVVPYGLGSGVCGAVLAGPGQVVLDMGKMDALVEINDKSLTATVQPGMRGSTFEQALQAKGFTMGHWPQSIDISTVGGWCATRASGQYSTRYGNIEDMLLGCEFAVPGGKLIRITPRPRSSTGPDLRELFLGSEGTLGVFTELVFRIHPLAPHSAARAFALPDVNSGLEALRLIMRAGWTPSVTRLYDAVEAGRNFAGMKTQNAPALLIMTDGDPARVETEMAEMTKIIMAHGGIDEGPEPVASWMDHRNNVPKFEDLLDGGLVADTIEVAIGWDKIDTLFETVCAQGTALEGMIVMSGHVSHCYTQGANIYFTFVATETDPDKSIELYDKAWNLTMKITSDLGGTVAHHHGIGRVRKKWLAKELGEAAVVMGALKKTIDPRGIMNPGALLDND